MMGGGVRNMNPFTAAQWQEFELQALIYKYMLSGVPVPPHLLLSISPTINYFSSTLLSPPQSTLGGWGENEIVAAGNVGGMSYGWGGRRIDLEPGRCRRTDGKKWRCSKEAHPESRYCERHMHRGRNRTTNNSCSRKPVEFPTSTAPPPATTMSLHASSSIIPPSLSHDYQNTLLYPSVHHPHFSSSSSSRPSPTTQHHFLDPTMPFPQQHKDHRYLQGMRDIQGETDRAFPHDPYTTPRMNQSHPFDFHSLMDKSKHEQNEHHEEQGPQHCYVLGTDIKTAPPRSSSISGLEARGGDQDNQDKPFHHFFSDWPQPSSRRDSTTCIDDFVGNQSNLTSTSTSTSTSTTTTQLSISMPLSTQDFFQSKPSPYW